MQRRGGKHERKRRERAAVQADIKRAGWADTGDRHREREMQTVIRADMYKVLCGFSLPCAHNPDLPPTNMTP